MKIKGKMKFGKSEVETLATPRGSYIVDAEKWSVVATLSPSAHKQVIREWSRPCFCRGSSTKTNVTLLLQGVHMSMNDFVSAGSQRMSKVMTFAFAGSRVPRQMWPCFCRGSTYQWVIMTLLLQGVRYTEWLRLCARWSWDLYLKIQFMNWTRV